MSWLDALYLFGALALFGGGFALGVSWRMHVDP